MVPVGVEEPLAHLHGAAGPQIVRQLPQGIGRFQTFQVEFRQGDLSQPQPQQGTGYQQPQQPTGYQQGTGYQPSMDGYQQNPPYQQGTGYQAGWQGGYQPTNQGGWQQPPQQGGWQDQSAWGQDASWGSS